MKTITNSMLAFSAGLVCMPVMAQVNSTGLNDKEHKRSIEEVVVTAQKRQERLQDVPISISVLGGDALDRSQDSGLLDALSSAPGVAIRNNAQGSTTTLAIRGVTATSPLFNGASPVGFYMDNLPFGFVRSAAVPDMNPYDLDRVEVLRGPQGTLYGASSLNGVVRVLTRDPDLKELSFKGLSAVSSTEGGGVGYSTNLAMNVPLISEKLAARVVAGYEEQAGWIDAPSKSDINSAELKNFRLKLKAELTDGLSAVLATWLSRDHANAPSISNDQDRITTDDKQENDTNFDTHSLFVTYDLPAVSISSATSYLEFTTESALSLDPLIPDLPPFDTDVSAKTVSQEFLFNSTSTKTWRWSAGLFYRDSEESLFQLFSGNDLTYESKSKAVFGQLTRSFLGDRLDVTAGLRYFEDEVSYTDHLGQVNTEPPLYESSSDFRKVTPKATVTWHSSPDTTLYASYGEGFRSGFSQFSTVTRLAPNFAPVGPDQLKNYEIGAKGDAFQDRMSFEVAVFYIDWGDTQQVVGILDDNSAAGFPAAINVGEASGFGVDLSLVVRPVDRLELGINGSWNDLALQTAIYSGGELLFDKGFRPLGSTEYTAGAWLNYGADIGGGWGINFEASGNYTSPITEVSIVGGNVDVQSGEPIFSADAVLSLDAPEHWTMAVFGKNLTDNRNFPSRNFGIPEWTSRSRPRTVGLQLEYRF